MKVTNYTIYRDNPYHDLIYGGIGRFYTPEKGTVDDAIDQLRRKDGNVLHVHWEEQTIRKANNSVEARIYVDHFVKRARRFVEEGGRIIWTVHNELPHELEFVDLFLELRQVLADLSSRILVHNTEAVAVLQRQVDVTPDRFYLLPHPSYSGIYEPQDMSVSEPAAGPGAPFLFFGKVREYKGLHFLLDSVAEADVDASFDVIGEPVRSERYCHDILDKHGDDDRFYFDTRRVPDEELPGLLRSHLCLVLPYERFLTSGAALLGMTFGAPIIAPDSRQIREVLPVEMHLYLFEQGNSASLVDAIERMKSVEHSEYAALRQAMLARSEYYHPDKVSTQLREVIDHVSAQ